VRGLLKGEGDIDASGGKMMLERMGASGELGNCRAERKGESGRQKGVPISEVKECNYRGGEIHRGDLVERELGRLGVRGSLPGLCPATTRKRSGGKELKANSVKRSEYEGRKAC